MNLKINFLGSPNFEVVRNRPLKYIIIHYTGMKNQKDAIKRLQSKVAKVSCHYIISKKGKIFQLVKDKHVAWHAGKSKWKKDINLNINSLGIELVNKGHEIFPKSQINSLILLLKWLRRKYNINPAMILGHEDISPNRKKDPGPRFPWSVLKKNNLAKKR